MQTQAKSSGQTQFNPGRLDFESWCMTWKFTMIPDISYNHAYKILDENLENKANQMLPKNKGRVAVIK